MGCAASEGARSLARQSGSQEPGAEAAVSGIEAN